MDRDPDSVEAEEILDLRCKVLTLAAAVGDLQPVAQALSVTERSFFRLDSARDFMQCALVNLQATDGQLTWLDGRVSALRSGFDPTSFSCVEQQQGHALSWRYLYFSFVTPLLDSASGFMIVTRAASHATAIRSITPAGSKCITRNVRGDAAHGLVLGKDQILLYKVIHGGEPARIYCELPGKVRNRPGTVSQCDRSRDCSRAYS